MALAKSDQTYLCILWVILSVLLKTYRLLLSAHALVIECKWSIYDFQNENLPHKQECAGNGTITDHIWTHGTLRLQIS